MPAGQESALVERLYANFSSCGVVSQYGSVHTTGSLPVLVHTSDIPVGWTREEALSEHCSEFTCRAAG
jgi:hypothetical protein